MTISGAKPFTAKGRGVKRNALLTERYSYCIYCKGERRRLDRLRLCIASNQQRNQFSFFFFAWSAWTKSLDKKLRGWTKRTFAARHTMHALIEKKGDRQYC